MAATRKHTIEGRKYYKMNNNSEKLSGARLLLGGGLAPLSCGPDVITSKLRRPNFRRLNVVTFFGQYG